MTKKGMPRQFRTRKKKDAVHCWIDGKPVRPRFNFMKCDNRRKKVRPLTARTMCSKGFQFFSRVCRLIANANVTYLYKRPFLTEIK